MSATVPATANNNTLAVNEKITTKVEKEILGMVESGRLALPADYAVGNALSAAWLKLQTVQNMDKKNVIVAGKINPEVVTETSVANALREYVIQGLSTDKNQAYFIVYGKALSMQRSYFGDQMLAQRVQPGIEFYSGVIYDGDEVSVEQVRGRVMITSHKTKFGNSDNAILGAYCGVVSATGEDLGVVLMTMKEIQKSWQQSKTYKAEGQGTHQKFPAEMALRTVTRKRCKSIINTSNDRLLLESIRASDVDAIEADVMDGVEEHANAEIIELPAQGSQVTEAIEEQEEKLPF